MKRILIIPLALVLMLIGAMAWSGGGVEKRADFAFINRGDIITLDLNQMSYMQDFRLTYAIREGLCDLSPETFRPIPAGAVSHDLSADKKVWTFHLRKESRWSNEAPVTARDYVFSWRRMLEEPGEYTYLYNYVKNAEAYSKSYSKGEPIPFKEVGIEAVDDWTLRVTLTNPVPYLLELVAFPPFYPRHEGSMSEFVVFTDTDVMDEFEKYIVAGKDAAAKKFKVTGGKVDWTGTTEPEWLEGLAAFAASDPLAGRPVTKVDAIVERDEDAAAADAMDKLTPKQKLERMVKTGFVRHSYKKDYTLPPKMVTNGAFVLRRWDFKRRLRLDKSETYWDRANTKSDTIEMVVAENPQSQLLLYESGAVDWLADVVGEHAAELKAAGRTDLKVSPAFGTGFITLLCSPKLPALLGGGNNPLADVRVRQALAMSVDKRSIVTNILRMGELPARTYLPPDGTLPDFEWRPGPFETGRKEPYRFEEMQKLLASDGGPSGPGPGLPYDVARARQLLAEAGYPNGKGFPSLPILFNTNNTQRRDICQKLKQQWREALNINVEIQGVEGKIFSRRISQKEYAIGTVAWYGDYPDVSTFTDKYLSGSLQNDSNWVNPKFDELCAKAAVEPDERKRAQMLSEAEGMIDAEAPIIPVFHYVNIALVKDRAFGVTSNPRNITIFKTVGVKK